MQMHPKLKSLKLFYAQRIFNDLLKRYIFDEEGRKNSYDFDKKITLKYNITVKRGRMNKF